MNNDSVFLTIPNKPDYISMVRLTTSSLANKLGFDFDTIEDIKVSIGEACINSLQFCHKGSISIVYESYIDKLTIKVSNCKDNIPKEIEEKKDRELGILIIKSLMDKVDFTDEGIEMTKYIK
ncbi:ATP-binding protein [Paratissierella segnis]|jgi:serine/threonine-protein kinase RsbW|nr:ATP-binding protein [Paratissierella segnis]